MSEKGLLMASEPIPEEKTRRLLRLAGTSYGVIFGLLYALAVWGYDGFLLYQSGAHLPWQKLFLGLPLALFLGGLMGWVGARYSSTPLSALLGAVVGGLLGWLTGHLPFDGATLVAGLIDRRFLGLEIYPYGVSAAVRTKTVVLVLVGLGAFIGMLQSFAADWAWNWATARGRMSFFSWLALFASLPLVLAMMAVVDEMVNDPVRTPQELTGDLIDLTLAEAYSEMLSQGLDYDSIRPFHAQLTPNYISHRSQYDLNALYSGYVRVNFDNGFTLRCFAIGNAVIYCNDFGAALAGWMEDLIHAGRTGERRWEERPYPNLVVDEAVMAWLDAQSDRLSDRYELTRVAEQGGWLLLAAQFDTGFGMTCRFHDESPMRIDQCTETAAVLP